MSHRARVAANLRLRRARDRARLRELLMAATCADCGTRDFTVLRFDLCEPLCGNCHRRRTAWQFGWGALLGRWSPRMYLLTWLRQHACAACGESGAVILDLDYARDTAHVLCVNCRRRQAPSSQSVESPSVPHERLQARPVRYAPAGVSLDVWIAKTC